MPGSQPRRFADTVVSQYSALLSYFRKRGFGRDSEDCVQNVWIEAAQSAGRYDHLPPDEQARLVHCIARRVTARWYDWRRTHQDREASYEVFAESGIEPGLEHETFTSASAPQYQTLAQRQGQAAAKAVLKLLEAAVRDDPLRQELIEVERAKLDGEAVPTLTEIGARHGVVRRTAGRHKAKLADAANALIEQTCPDFLEAA